MTRITANFTETGDWFKCNYCGRLFSQRDAYRHIPCPDRPDHGNACDQGCVDEDSGDHPDDQCLEDNLYFSGCELEDIHGAELEGSRQIDLIDIELEEGEVPSRVISKWTQVADHPVTPNADLTVRDVAFLHVHEMRRSSTTFTAMGRILRLMAHAGAVKGPSGPFEPNKWPPSLHICRRILDVPDLSNYERHVCPKGCRFYFAHLSDHQGHLQNCGGCKRCKCPLCNSEGYIITQWGSAEPYSKCYLLHDVIEQWLLNEKWVAALVDAVSTLDSAWYRSKECERIEDALQNMLGEEYRGMPVWLQSTSLVS
jgi:hypothetical protein